MTDGKPKDYEVGKGKPPKEHQFQPGQSGNPKGRPPGSKNVHHVLSKILKEKITVTDAGKKMVVDKFEATMRAMVNKAFEGRPQSLKLLLEVLRYGDDPDEQPPSQELSDEDYKALLDEADWIEEARDAHKEAQSNESP